MGALGSTARSGITVAMNVVAFVGVTCVRSLMLDVHTLCASIAALVYAMAAPFPVATWSLTVLGVVCAVAGLMWPALSLVGLAIVLGLFAYGWWAMVLLNVVAYCTFSITLSSKLFVVCMLASASYACYTTRGLLPLLMAAFVGASFAQAYALLAAGNSPETRSGSRRARREGRARRAERGGPSTSAASDSSGWFAGNDAGASSGADSATMSSQAIIDSIVGCDTHYEVLRLSPDAPTFDAASLRKTYLQMSRRVHPDKNPGNEQAARAFSKLQASYEVLSDSSKRAEYDMELEMEELYGDFDETYPGVPDRPTGSARWCAACDTFHAAEDGDLWVEEREQKIIFGLSSRPVRRYFVCEAGRVIEITDWAHKTVLKHAPANRHSPLCNVHKAMGATNKNSKADKRKARGSKKQQRQDEKPQKGKRSRRRR